MIAGGLVDVDPAFFGNDCPKKTKNFRRAPGQTCGLVSRVDNQLCAVTGMSEALVQLDEPAEIKVQQNTFKQALLLKELREKYFRGRFYLAVAATIFLVSFAISTINVPLNYDSNHKPYFTYNDLVVDENDVLASFGRPKQPGHKVMVIVVDGLRYDFLTTHPELSEFMNSIKADSKTVLLRAQLPSISHPNWVTLLTSARPQFTGVTSNNDPFIIPKIFDTIFKRAEKAGLKRGLVGSAGWSAFIHDNLQPGGDFSIFNLHEDESEGTPRHPAGSGYDKACAKVVDGILDEQNTPNAYDLFWAYLTDVDARSHQSGPFSERAMSAVRNVTQVLQNVVNKLDSNTILVITADHGHVDAGGHGGTEDSVRDVPFVIYKKGSGINNIPSAQEWQGNDRSPSNLEFAPTICGLLGIPVPLQSEGVFLDETLLFMSTEAKYWHYRQLYVQKSQFVNLFSRTVGLNGASTVVQGDTAAHYRQAVIDLVDEFNQLLERAMLLDGFFNLFLGSVTLVAHIALFSVLLHYMSGANLMSICGCCHFLPHQRRHNRKGFLIGTIVTILLLVISVAVQYAVMSVSPRFYAGWYPSFSTYNSAIDTYMIITAQGIISLIVRFLLSWILTEWVWNRFQKKILTPQEIYLAQYSVVLILLRLTLFTPETWDFQFLVGDLGIILVPVLLYSILSFFFFTNTDVGFDTWKERHVPVKEADEQNLLDEESDSVTSHKDTDTNDKEKDPSVSVEVVESRKDSITINDVSTDTSSDEDEHHQL